MCARAWASVAVCGSLLCMRRVYLLLLRTHYVFTDVRTTYLPMYVLLLLLIYRCTYYTLTDFTYYYYVPMYLPLLTEPGACPSALLWADLLINVRSLSILTYRAGRVPEAEPIGKQLEERAAARLLRLRVRG